MTPGATVVEVTSRTPLPNLPLVHVVGREAHDRAALVGKASRLTWLSLGWHGVEAAVAIAAGGAGGVGRPGGLWRRQLDRGGSGAGGSVAGERRPPESHRHERRAQQLIAASFLLLAAYVFTESARDLIAGHHPEASWLGVGLAAVTLVTMPPLAAAKRRVGRALGSSATVSESRQTMLCAYLSAALLIGLLANAVTGWWWADPIVALAIGTVALREARQAWRGESCGCC